MATCSSLQLPIYSLGGYTVVLYAANLYIHTQVPELKILDVSSNFLVDAQPQPWAGLAKLEELDVSDNSLSKVGGLATLTSLTRLHINRNQLQDLVSDTHHKARAVSWFRTVRLPSTLTGAHFVWGGRGQLSACRDS